jgi:hypothetical protein
MSTIPLFIRSIIKGDMLIKKNPHNEGYRPAGVISIHGPEHCKCTQGLHGGHQ